MTKTKELSVDELAEEYINQSWFDLEYSTFGSTAKEVKKAIEWAYQSCLEQLAKADGEFSEVDLIFDFHPEYIIAEVLDAKGELKSGKFIQLEAIQALNTKLALSEQRVKELEDIIEKHKAVRDRFKVFGTDACPDCENGRITIYKTESGCINCKPEQYTSKFVQDTYKSLTSELAEKDREIEQLKKAKG